MTQQQQRRKRPTASSEAPPSKPDLVTKWDRHRGKRNIDDVMVISLADIEAEVQEWIVDDFVPFGVFMLLVGREGIGKGLWTARLAALVTKGKTKLKGRRNVFVYAVEDSTSKQTLPRFKAAGADVKRVKVYARKPTAEPDERPNTKVFLDFPDDIEMLRSTITDHDISVVIIDPLMSVMNSGIRPSEEPKVRRVLEALANLAEETGCTILALMHFNKATGLDVLDRIMHSRAFSAISRHTLAAGHDPEDSDGRRIAVVVAKSNVGPVHMAQVFDVEQVSTGLLDQQGDQTMIGRLALQRSVPQMNPNSVLDRPKAAEESPAAVAIRGLMPDLDGVYSGEEMNATLTELGFSKHAVTKAVKDLGIERLNIGGLYHWASRDLPLRVHQAAHTHECPGCTPLGGSVEDSEESAPKPVAEHTESSEWVTGQSVDSVDSTQSVDSVDSLTPTNGHVPPLGTSESVGGLCEGQRLVSRRLRKS